MGTDLGNSYKKIFYLYEGLEWSKDNEEGKTDTGYFTTKL